MDEIWKDISGYEGVYQVSNLGNVRSLDRLICDGRKLNGRLLKQSNHSHGYLQVGLSKNGKTKIKKVHCLVAEAFITNHENKPQVNHIDEDKLHNIVTNLEWVTAKENMNHGTSIERRSKKLSHQIKCSNGIIYPSIMNASIELCIADSNIVKHLQGKRAHVGGYTFERIDK